MERASHPETWRSGAARAAEGIGTGILRGVYPEGARLPREEELAEQLGVSRNTLREAVKLLAAKSLVRVAPRRGTVVLPRAAWNILDADILDWLGPDIGRDPAFLEELGRMRQVIEPAAAYDAARHGDPAGLAAIAEAYAKMSALAQDAPTDAKVAADLAFHVAVAGASGNRFFQSITGSILHALRRSFEALIDPPGNYEANLANHRAVRDAIRAGQAEAAEAAMTKLLRQSANATARLRGREPGQHGRATG